MVFSPSDWFLSNPLALAATDGLCSLEPQSARCKSRHEHAVSRENIKESKAWAARKTV